MKHRYEIIYKEVLYGRLYVLEVVAMDFQYAINYAREFFGDRGVSATITEIRKREQAHADEKLGVKV